jgi:hypothetical protein
MGDWWGIDGRLSLIHKSKSKSKSKTRFPIPEFRINESRFPNPTIKPQIEEKHEAHHPNPTPIPEFRINESRIPIPELTIPRNQQT